MFILSKPPVAEDGMDPVSAPARQGSRRFIDRAVLGFCIARHVDSTD